MAKAFANLAVSSLKVKKFSGQEANKIDDWIRDLEYAATASGWSSDQIMLKLPLYLEGTALDLYELELKSSGTTWDMAKDVLRNHFLPSNHKVHLFEEIMSTKQEPSESVSTFITRMRRKIQQWKPNCPVDDTINFITSGLLPAIKQGLKQFPTATSVSEFKSICIRQEDAMKERIGARCYAVTDQHSINYVATVPNSQTGFDFQSFVKEMKESFMTLNSKLDSQDGKIDQLAKKVAMLERRSNKQQSTDNFNGIVVCYNCAQEGHKVPDCPNPKRGSNNDKSRPTINMIEDDDNVDRNELIYAQVKINDHVIQGIVDSGASRTLISEDTANAIGLEYKATDKTSFRLGDGSSRIKILGKTSTLLKIYNSSQMVQAWIDVFVVSSTNQMIIGIDTIASTGMTIYGKSKKFTLSNDFSNLQIAMVKPMICNDENTRAVPLNPPLLSRPYRLPPLSIRRKRVAPF